MYKARYVKLYETGELAMRVQAAKAMLLECNLCPHGCGVDRTAGEQGVCRAGSEVRISGAAPHFGEESVLTGRRGSGTVFFAHCNLGCSFCQNYEISHLGRDQSVSEERLARVFMQLQQIGCHNINLVSPTHYVPQILSALCYAVELGLNLPLVYNTGGFDSPATLGLLDGVVDIYMPDIKFFDESSAARYLGTDKYPAAVREAVTLMHEQVGDLLVDERGLTVRGLLIRHLVMPGHTKDTEAILCFISESISTNTYVNIMAQYRPNHRTDKDDTIGKIASAPEIVAAHQAASRFGLLRARAY